MGARFTFDPTAGISGIMRTVAYASVYAAGILNPGVDARDVRSAVAGHRSNPVDGGDDLEKLVAIYIVIGDHVSRMIVVGGWEPEDDCGPAERIGMTLASIACRWREEPVETKEAMVDMLATVDREDAWVGVTFALAAMRRLYAEVGTMEVDE